MSEVERSVVRLVGVYDADHTLRGELSYWIGARLGRAHCSLCDITHGLFRQRADWKVCREGIPVRFDTYHRDDQPDAVRAALAGVVPAVVAETSEGVVLLLGPAELEACDGSPERLVAAVDAAVRGASLTF
ncbi:MAG: hypothetical protein ACOYMR_07970 [Ilumatobacteraceae bacterium]